MGKTKQTKERKFDRNIEISAPILDPEVIKQIHSPPKDQRLDIRHGGFKALLSDLNSQDSTDEVTPITDSSHLPSYIGISCAVSGYSNYRAYSKKPTEELSDASTEKQRQSRPPSCNKQTKGSTLLSRSKTNSPYANRIDESSINHITVDRSQFNSDDQERKELTEKFIASTSERRRSPSPLPPLEDDRHHGAYVGARYCPMPPPSKLVHKHIPLLGIDDNEDPDQVKIEGINKVEEKIATLYGDDFVENWKESMTHKAKKEHHDDYQDKLEPQKSPKDLVNLKSSPSGAPKPEDASKMAPEVPTPNIKVLEGVEKQFLNKLLTDENPPVPRTPSPLPSSPTNIRYHGSQLSYPTVAQNRLISPLPDSPTPEPSKEELVERERLPKPVLLSSEQINHNGDLAVQDGMPPPISENTHFEHLEDAYDEQERHQTPISEADSPDSLKEQIVEDGLQYPLSVENSSLPGLEERVTEDRVLSPIIDASSPDSIKEQVSEGRLSQPITDAPTSDSAKEQESQDRLSSPTFEKLSSEDLKEELVAEERSSTPEKSNASFPVEDPELQDTLISAISEERPASTLQTTSDSHTNETDDFSESSASPDSQKLVDIAGFNQQDISLGPGEAEKVLEATLNENLIELLEDESQKFA